MSARDELVRTIRGTQHMYALHLEVPADIVEHVANGIADALLAAGYRKLTPRELSFETIETEADEAPRSYGVSE